MASSKVMALAISLALVGMAAALPRQLLQTEPLGGSPETACDVLVVGGGPGGVYSAYRILEVNASTNVCLLEATGRVGGRVYSIRGLGPKGDLVVDAGAYRYMPLAQNLITDIIEGLLKLPNRLYQPAIPDYKIVLTPDGSNAGYATYVEALLAQATSLGLKTYFNTKVLSVNTTVNSSMLTVTTDVGETFMANQVILNLPTRPMDRVLSSSNIETVYNKGIYYPEDNRAVKLYLYYDNAFWIAQGLNNASLTAVSAFSANNVVVPLVARYYDGQVKCPTTANAAVYQDYYYTENALLNTQSCYGYFQAVYTSASSNSANTSQAAVAYLTDYMSSTSNDVPYRIVTGDTAKGMKLLNDSHATLISYIQAHSPNVTLTATQISTLPTHAVVVVWDQGVSWSGGGWHGAKDPTQGTPAAVQANGVIHPFPNLPIYIADEAYSPSTTQGWSEGSLVLAENIIQTYFNGTQAPWMRNTTLSNVIFGPNWNDYESAAQGGGATATVSTAAPPGQSAATTTSMMSAAFAPVAAVANPGATAPIASTG